MSPKRNHTVSDIARKYRQRFSSDSRPDLRRRIRTENPNIFLDNLSNLRKLDRCLRKEFGNPFNSGAKISGVKENTGKEGVWNPLPDFSFSPKFEEANRRLREPFEVDTDEPPQFPIVPFHWRNFSPYKIGVRLEVQVFLGGKPLGLINDPKGYYNGKALITVEPSRGMRDGRFWLPPECGSSAGETTIEVLARITDENDEAKKEYNIVKSWSFDPKKNDWYFEPKTFSDELKVSQHSSSWTLLVDSLKGVGAYLKEIPIIPSSPSKQQSTEQLTGPRNIQGILMLKGAKNMQAAIRIAIPDEYEGFLFTKDIIAKEEKVAWQSKILIVKEVEEIYETYDFSYRVIKLVKPFEPWAVSIDW